LQTGEFCHLSCFVCQIKRTNACSSPISSSERPDSQANSARKAGSPGWSLCNCPTLKNYESKTVSQKLWDKPFNRTVSCDNDT
jgi:hypothetical protein